MVPYGETGRGDKKTTTLAPSEPVTLPKFSTVNPLLSWVPKIQLTMDPKILKKIHKVP